MLSHEAEVLYRNAVRDFECGAALNKHGLASTKQAYHARRLLFFEKIQEGHGPAVGRNTLFGWVALRGTKYEKTLRGLGNAERVIEGWPKTTTESTKKPCL